MSRPRHFLPTGYTNPKYLMYTSPLNIGFKKIFCNQEKPEILSPCEDLDLEEEPQIHIFKNIITLEYLIFHPIFQLLHTLMCTYQQRILFFFRIRHPIRQSCADAGQEGPTGTGCWCSNIGGRRGNVFLGLVLVSYSSKFHMTNNILRNNIMVARQVDQKSL